MSHADTQFQYISGSDSRSLSSSYRTVDVGDRSGSISGSGCRTSAPVRRSSSVSSYRRRQLESDDANSVTLRWSKTRYSVEELAQEFERCFPLLVRVTQGYCCSDVNGSSSKLDVGQVRLIITFHLYNDPGI